MKCIRNFYSLLYKKGNNGSENEIDNDFFKHCPKLNEKRKQLLDEDISEDELAKALSSCKESAPGPDGITYKVYKNFWSILNSSIIESWIFSVETVVKTYGLTQLIYNLQGYGIVQKEFVIVKRLIFKFV
jgi:hypothetical protein